MISNTDIGKNYEQIAVKYLKNLGYKVIEQNYRLLPIGEIDIIVKDKKTLVFVEVKFRQNKDYGNPSEFVNKLKQLKITKTALYYIKINSVKSDIRFDVISICNDDIEHIKNAFCVDNKNYYF
ncbi:MAG: YraN family protein [Endomicrobiaceae bacterium]|nr:YraN family protein [Endomicrobiaceae bacterium]